MKNIVTALLLIICTTQAWSQIPAAREPQNLPDTILRTLRPGHPKLHANAKDFSLLKERITTDSTLRIWFEKLVLTGDNLLSEPPSLFLINDGIRLLSVSRKVLDRIYTLGLLYRLTGSPKYAERAWKELEAASKFPDWNPSHFLDVAEMSHAFAIGYDWFYDALTIDQRRTVRSAIVEKGLNQALLAYGGITQNGAHWINSGFNWNIVCNGAMSIAALAIAEEEPKLAEHVLHKTLGFLPTAMKGFGPDGAWEEGPGYWGYTTRYAVALLSVLETTLGTDFGLGGYEGFSETALFPLYLTGPLQRAFNYADASEGPAGGAQLFWLAKKYGHIRAAAFQKAMVKSPTALDLLWFPVALFKGTSKEIPLAARFRRAEVMTMRSSWTDRNAWFLGFKGGDNQAAHSNLDLGSFVLDAMGQRWVVDLGHENYNLPGYWSSGKSGRRWNYYRMRAEGHNTLVLNPDKMPDQNPLAISKIIKFSNRDKAAFAIADLSAAYVRDADQVRRGIALVEGDCVLIHDEITAQTPADLYWFLHTPAKIEISRNGRRATLVIGSVKMQAELIAPARARFSSMPASPLPSSPHPEGAEKNADIQKLIIYLDQVSHERIIVELKTPGNHHPETKAFYSPLDMWK